MHRFIFTLIFLFSAAYCQDKASDSFTLSNLKIDLETKNHFDNASNAVIQFFGHSAGAAASIETMPPLAIIEIYNATNSMIEACSEYNKGRNIKDKKDSK